MVVEFGKCDVDGAVCYSKGCICRLNPKAGFQFEFKVGVRVPFRNKVCCWFDKVEVGV